MTVLDWLIVAFALLLAFWGYQQGLIVGALTLGGFVLGGLIGSRIGPALLPDGSHSPYAPATALAGAVLIGAIVAVTVEEGARALRRRVVRGPNADRVDGFGGALLAAALAIGVAWLFGAAALNAPGARDLREAVQRSTILAAVNDVLPPSTVLNALNRIDPGLAIPGPEAAVGPPDPKIAADPDVDRAGDSVVKVLGTACGLGVEGSGWVAGPGLVVTNAHVVAGEDDTTVTSRDGSVRLDATAVHYEPENDLAVLRVDGLDLPALPISGRTEAGTSGAVLGYPENGSLTVAAARLGATEQALSQDSYGRGPINRTLVSLRGRIRSGNSGGPMVDPAGGVLTTVFAATTSGRPGGFGVPNSFVRAALRDSDSPVDTGPCT